MSENCWVLSLTSGELGFPIKPALNKLKEAMVAQNLQLLTDFRANVMVLRMLFR